MAAPAHALVPAFAGGPAVVHARKPWLHLNPIATAIPMFAAQIATDSGSPRPRPGGAGTGLRGSQRPAARRAPGRGPDGSRPDHDATGAAPEQDPVAVDEAHAETWQLVARAQAGDGEAFGQLYDRYFDVVFRFVYYRVHDHALAEDITSETFLRALRRITSISYQGRDIGAWFVTIARNIILDHLKSARHRLERTTAQDLDGSETVPSTEAAVLASLQSQQLMQAIGQLGIEQRECIVLRFVQGMSVSETAEIMGKKNGAIKALQHRAVRKLADIVGPEHP